MPVIHAADARTFSVPGSTFTSLAAPSRGAAETAVWILTIAPGSIGTPHRLTREEVFVATAGRATATIGGHTHEIAAGVLWSSQPTPISPSATPATRRSRRSSPFP